MFGRRVFASAPIPPSMFARLNISSAQQAQRRLPSLVPVSAIMARPMSSCSLQLLSGVGCGLALSQQLALLGSPTDLLEHIDVSLSGAIASIHAICNLAILEKLPMRWRFTTTYSVARISQ